MNCEFSHYLAPTKDSITLVYNTDKGMLAIRWRKKKLSPKLEPDFECEADVISLAGKPIGPKLLEKICDAFAHGWLHDEAVDLFQQEL